MAAQVISKGDLLTIFSELLEIMEEEIVRDHYTLSFNDAWQEAENALSELESELGS